MIVAVRTHELSETVSCMRSVSWGEGKKDRRPRVRGSKQVFDAAIAVPDKERRGERRRSPEGVAWMDTDTLL